MTTMNKVQKVTKNQVAEQDSCPQCGEDDADYLVWDDEGETVECTNCGMVYVPNCAY